MKTIFIDSLQHPLYADFRELYKVSFPIFEQRSTQMQRDSFSNDSYRVAAYLEGEKFVGFIAYWEFDNYIYIEHFAISTSLRGKGYGSRLISDFVASVEKIVVLEIDPVVDAISQSRLKFYLQCGFVENPYHHTHPPYSAQYSAHQLVVMSVGRQLTDAEFQRFAVDLKCVVMGVLLGVKSTENQSV